MGVIGPTPGKEPKSVDYGRYLCMAIAFAAVGGACRLFWQIVYLFR